MPVLWGERTKNAEEKLEIEKYLTAAPRILDPAQALTAGMIHAVTTPLLEGEFVIHAVHS